MHDISQDETVRYECPKCGCEVVAHRDSDAAQRHPMCEDCDAKIVDGPDATCEERIAAQLVGRVTDFATLRELSSAYDTDSLLTALEDRATCDMLAELLTDAMVVNGTELPTGAALHALTAEELRDYADHIDVDALREAADERRDELPLSVSSQTVFRIDLSTGGPADWLEVVCSGDTPCYEPAGDGEHFEVERVVYHFADWFDHAERTLDGYDFDAAASFAQRVVPELCE